MIEDNLMELQNYTLYLVSHTHWDREWYLPYSQMTVQLVSLIDGLLEILKQDNNYLHFTLDGQMAIIDDYLDIRPEKKHDICKLVKEGRLIIGPWYTLPDENLVSGEALVRNLLLGTSKGQEIGGYMNVGYLSDEFGHTKQMPQILKGFNIPYAFISRGANRKETNMEFFWIAPDGSSVLTLCYGYGGGGNLPENEKLLKRRIKNYIDSVKGQITTGNILIMNGGDNLEPQPNLPKIIDLIKKYMGVTVKHSTLEEYARTIENSSKKLKKIDYELRYKLQDLPTHLYDVISSRYYLKKANRDIENFYTRYVEIIASLAYRCGLKYPKEFLERGWRYIILNQAHDSICGCGVDAVHKDMLSRYRWAKEIGQMIFKDSLNYIVSNINSHMEKDCYNIIVYNPYQEERTGIVECTVNLHPPLDVQHEIKKGRKEWGMYSDIAYPAGWHGRMNLSIKDNEGYLGPIQLYSLKEKKERELTSYLSLFDHADNPFQFRFMANKVPACGYKVFSLVKNEVPQRFYSDIRVIGHSMENKYIKVKILENATIDVLDKQTNVEYKGLHIFEDNGDIGGGWDSVKPSNDTVFTSKNCKGRIEVTNEGPLVATIKVGLDLKLPVACTSNGYKRKKKMVSCPLACYFSINAESPLIWISTIFENNAMEHRLRVAFNTNINSKKIYTDSVFNEIERDIDENLKDWPTEPHIDYISVREEKKQFSVLNRGIYEYEATGNPVNLKLTLLRSNTKNSRHWWPNVITPDAESRGKNNFEYALLVSDVINYTPKKGSLHYQNPLVAYEIQELESPYTIKDKNHMPWCIRDKSLKKTGLNSIGLNRSNSLFSIKGKYTQLNSIKKHEERESLIVRLNNPASEDETVIVNTTDKILDIFETNMKEERLRKLDNTCSLTVPAKKILTYEIVQKVDCEE